MVNFTFVGFPEVQAIPVKIPFSNWIYAANDDKYLPARKK